MPRTIGYFSLSGEFDPDEITQRLGIEPSWCHRIGDPGPPDAKGPRRGAEWCLACADDDFGDVGDQIISLVCKLERKSEIVSELSAKFWGTFYLVAYLDGNYPGFFLSSRFVRDLASLNVDLDCAYTYAPDGLTESNEESEDAN